MRVAINTPGLCNPVACFEEQHAMRVHVIQLGLGAFMSSLGVTGRTKSWEAPERNPQCEENENIDIGKSQRLRKEGNARINKVSAVKPGSAKIIEKVRISWYFGSPEIDLHIAENACCIDYVYTCWSKWVHWLSKSTSLHRVTTNYECEATVEFNAGVARARWPITGIHTRVAPISKIHWLLATFPNSKWVDHCEVCHGSNEAISILDPVDVKEAYSHIVSLCHSVQQHVRSHGWCDGSVRKAEYSMDARFVLRCEVSCTEAVQILRWSETNDGHAAHFCTYPRSFLELEIV